MPNVQTKMGTGKNWSDDAQGEMIKAFKKKHGMK